MTRRRSSVERGVGAGAADHRATPQSVLSSTQRVLLCCARTRLTDADAQRLLANVGAGIDWAELEALADLHGLVPLVSRHLGAACPHLVPGDVLRRLRASAAATAATNLALAGELADLVRVLADRGIRVMPFKGPLVAVQVYGNLGLRPFVDLDVAVPRPDLAAARATLIANGYRSVDDLSATQDATINRAHGHYVLARSASVGAVELHWRFAPECFGSLSPEEVLQRAERVPLAGTLVPTLAPDDLLVTLCIHGGKHAWERLEWLCGVAEVIRGGRAGVGRVLAIAARLHSTRTVLVALRLAQVLLDVRLPPDAERAVAADREVPALVKQVIDRLFAPVGTPVPTSVGAQWAFQLRSRERLRDRIRLLYHVTMLPTPAEWAAIRLDDRLTPLYRLVRPLRLVGKYGRQAIRRAE